MYVNWVDADDPRYFRINELDTIMNFIDEAMNSEKPILIHCDQNQSRSPAVVMLYLAAIGILPRKFEDAAATFVHMYPYFKPNTGICEFIKQNWAEFAEI